MNNDKAPSLKRNIFFGYLSQVYLIVISVIMLPLYIKYMGAEAYGLVGFYAVLQGLFALLDFGLTPAISRQTAYYNAGEISKLNFLKIFRSLNIIFLIIAFMGMLLIIYFNEYIAFNWLNSKNLSRDVLVFSVNIMAILVALKWMMGLYKGVLIGFELIEWLSKFNIIIASFRYLGVFPFMFFLGFNIKIYFIYQLVVLIFEFIFLFYKSRKKLPIISEKELIGWSLKPIKKILKFSSIIAFTSFIWVILNNLDKMILSSMLLLSEYGYFTLAVIVAGGVIQINTPISSVIMPRLAKLNALNKNKELEDTYIFFTQFVTIVVVTAGIVLSQLANQVLYIWTGDISLSEKVSPILELYAIGNVFVVLSAFCYYLQYAKGNLKYHLIGNIINICLVIPSIIYFSSHYGVMGAGWVWLISQFIYLLCWVTFVHHKINPTINLRWYRAFLPSIISVILFLFICNEFFTYSSNRWICFAQVIFIGVCSLIISLLSSSDARSIFFNKFIKFKFWSF